MKYTNRNEEGQGLVEYALVLVMVALTLILILSLLGSQIILAYGNIIGALGGDSFDDNAVLLASDTSITGTTVCTATMQDIRFIAKDGDGKLITNANVVVNIRANGVNSGTLSGMASGSGIVSVAGPTTVAGGCPLEITLSK